MKLPIAIAFLLGLSAEAPACDWAGPPAEAPEATYDALAASIIEESAAIADAIVERPTDYSSDHSYSLLRITRLWTGKVGMHFRAEVKTDCDIIFPRAGEVVRVALIAEQDGYHVSLPLQSLLDHPKVMAALARRLRQPLLANPLRSQGPAAGP